ncbi:MAG: Uma2 family endonuclease [Accumulibacter sp.]|uniref:Uma2 family endonuclease n=1 Tax=Accumulibacter sp. TaxID=2053492 RepID=UPI002FC32A2D
MPLRCAALLRSCLRGTSCRAFVADAKLRIARSGAFCYPDVMVTCNPRHLTIGDDDQVVEAPKAMTSLAKPAAANSSDVGRMMFRNSVSST